MTPSLAQQFWEQYFILYTDTVEGCSLAQYVLDTGKYATVKDIAQSMDWTIEQVNAVLKGNLA